MSKPTEEELKEALATAGEMRESGNDPHHIAKALLNMNYRVQKLEHVLFAAEMYMHSGMAVQEHQKLKKAIEEARREVERTSYTEREQFGLG